jgi:PST family polysaccharide transporter
MYVVYLPMVYWLARCKTEFRWAPTVWRHLAWLMLAAVALLLVAEWSAMGGAVAGLIMSSGLGLYGFSQLAHKTNLTGPLGRMAGVGRQWLTKNGVWRDRD